MPISDGTQVSSSTWNCVTGYAGIIFAQRIHSNLFWFKLTMLVSGFTGCIVCTTVKAHSGMSFVSKFIRIQPSKTYSCRLGEFAIALLVASKCQQCIHTARHASRSRVMEKENVWLFGEKIHVVLLLLLVWTCFNGILLIFCGWLIRFITWKVCMVKAYCYGHLKIINFMQTFWRT